MKKVLMLISLLVFLNFGCKLNPKYSDKLTLKVSPIKEDCDGYKVIWNVDSVDNLKFQFLINEQVYFTKNNLNYRVDTNKIIVQGYLYKKKYSRDYIGCSKAFFFERDSVYNVLTNTQL